MGTKKHFNTCVLAGKPGSSTTHSLPANGSSHQTNDEKLEHLFKGLERPRVIARILNVDPSLFKQEARGVFVSSCLNFFGLAEKCMFCAQQATATSNNNHERGSRQHPVFLGGLTCASQGHPTPVGGGRRGDTAMPTRDKGRASPELARQQG